MLLKGEGENAEHIVGGAERSTLAHDAFPARWRQGRHSSVSSPGPRRQPAGTVMGYRRAVSNGLWVVTPNVLKSVILRVTTVNLCTCAVAAIMASS